MRTDVKYVAAGGAGAGLLAALMTTTRLSTIHPERLDDAERAAGAAVVALWHGELLIPTWHYRRRRFATMASRSGDGEYITRMLHHWGYRVARGSSSRGGDTALRELARHIRQGHSVALTADGPRGPRRRLKHGVLRLAQLTGVPVVPVASAADRCWRLGSWDAFMVPEPFSRVVIAFGEAVPVARSSSAGDIAETAGHVESVMAELQQVAEEAVR
ncbi:MAG TPA: lysophospholipid acyltransferase family protein [Longimicrobiales bacterium]|nr:lysophospholipid acyltransferase family protein [Longimicrobiales bacterium]